MTTLQQDWASEWLPLHDAGVNESKVMVADAMTVLRAGRRACRSPSTRAAICFRSAW